MSAAKHFRNGFHQGTKEFGSYITTIVNTVLLSLAYILGIGFTAIFAKAKKKNFLVLKPTAAKSYWVDLNLKKEQTEKYYRQF
jgi:hypothetical protein